MKILLHWWAFFVKPKNHQIFDQFVGPKLNFNNYGNMYYLCCYKIFFFLKKNKKDAWYFMEILLWSFLKIKKK